MRILVVDDDQERHDFFRRMYRGMDDIIVQAYDYDNALLEISSTPYDFDLMFLDHDLTGPATMMHPDETFEKTGSDIAEYIAREIDAIDCVDMTIYCHSMNPMGRANMVKILSKAGFNVIDEEFYSLRFKLS